MQFDFLDVRYGLRELALTRRANAGASTDMLKAFGGHATSKEVERYTREAAMAAFAELARPIGTPRPWRGR
jgi:hypothetical protein